MRFKLIMALAEDSLTDGILEAARAAGATGCTVITSARGEGLTPQKTFLGLDLSGQRDLLLFLVAEQRAREILEEVSRAGKFDTAHGTGIAFQIAIEDAIGLSTQHKALAEEIEEDL
ncbi:MAG: P-II family nitrogen regulator [Proteobacteria bacterium]|nr:P-II family nitrogen regulator [Pseudomonadota bacterium]MDA1132341.1 P-II family nitrogen regulator [Pseudomonadota bacterium]